MPRSLFLWCGIKNAAKPFDLFLKTAIDFAGLSKAKNNRTGMPHPPGKYFWSRKLKRSDAVYCITPLSLEPRHFKGSGAIFAFLFVLLSCLRGHVDPKHMSLKWRERLLSSGKWRRFAQSQDFGRKKFYIKNICLQDNLFGIFLEFTIWNFVKRARKKR